jgi:heptaprenyl diphosphate synthase
MKKTTTLTLCAMLISLALALSYTERFIPLQMLIPLPGIKLGLANIVTLTALYLLGTKSAFTILILRCFLGSLFGGGITGFLFSLCGGLLSMTVMTLARRLSCFSVYGVSILGAAAHNIGQIAVAILLMRSVYIGAYLPYLLIVALFTGFATGSACAGILKILLRLRYHRSGSV